jgi:mono/diheme cytochrome c family protein
MSAHALKEALLATAATCAIATSIITSLSGPANAEEVELARVFTTAQATAGKAAFEKNCAACHMRDLSGDADAPQLAGTQFMSTWRTRSTKDLFQYMSTAMPPGSSPLSADVYTSITAYVLQSNGAAAGPEPLTTTSAVSIARVAPQKAR